MRNVRFTSLLVVFALPGLVVLEACSRHETPAAPPERGPASSAPAPSASSPAAATSSATPPRVGGPVKPTLALDVSDQSPSNWKVNATGLPAVSRDGARIAYLFSAEAGPSGYASDTLAVRRVDGDAIEHEASIFVPKEVTSAESAPNASATTLPALVTKLKTRVEAAAKLVEGGDWIALVPMKAEGDAGAAAVHAQGVEVTLSDGKLRATHGTGQVVAEADARVWAAKPTPAGHGLPACAFEPELAEASVDLVRHVLVVTVTQRAKARGDVCFAPSSVHALKL